MFPSILSKDYLRQFNNGGNQEGGKYVMTLLSLAATHSIFWCQWNRSAAKCIKTLVMLVVMQKRMNMHLTKSRWTKWAEYSGHQMS